MDSKIAVLYGPTGGNTEYVAQLIEQQLGKDKCLLIPVNDANSETLAHYNKIILGVSTIGTHTWKQKNVHSDWDVFLPLFRKIDFSGKKVALFGLGDQIAYANHFVDDIKILYDIVVEQKGTIIGQCSTDGYDFNDSAALVDGLFIGLPIDHDRQPEHTTARVNKWVDQIVLQF